MLTTIILAAIVAVSPLAKDALWLLFCWYTDAKHNARDASRIIRAAGRGLPRGPEEGRNEK